LQAVFASLPQANGLAVREISLVYFRDIVVLKTKLDEVIDGGREVPPRIVQMLLVLQVREMLFQGGVIASCFGIGSVDFKSLPHLH
jgi:hypothetical protein